MFLKLYTATDADGNRGKCGFTITVLANGSASKPEVLPAPTATSSRTNRNRNRFKNLAEDENNNNVNACTAVPNIENGRMVCKNYGISGKKCSPICNEGHQFYQKFVSQPPVYLCLPPRRVDWKIRKFIPDCSPTHQLSINGRQCEAGWEQRGAGKKCVACPPGMYRPQKDPLCQLCPKGLYADQFGSANCVRCPLYHTTKGLGSRKTSQCYYHRSATRSRIVDHRQKKARKKNSVGASFMHYSRWKKRT